MSRECSQLRLFQSFLAVFSCFLVSVFDGIIYLDVGGFLRHFISLAFWCFCGEPASVCLADWHLTPWWLLLVPVNTETWR